jgi:hypothetical protein
LNLLLVCGERFFVCDEAGLPLSLHLGIHSLEETHHIGMVLLGDGAAGGGEEAVLEA